MKYKKGDAYVLSPHFIVNEFDCQCLVCQETIVDPQLITRLEAMRSSIGKPLRINSGYRCEAYQLELRLRGYETSIGISQHQLGRAADVSRADEGSTGVELEAEARKAGFKAVGVGHSFIHVDLRDDKERRWEYLKR